MHSIDIRPRVPSNTNTLSKLFVFVVLMLVAWGDYATGFGISFTILYAIPAVLAIAAFGYKSSLAIAALSSVVRLIIVYKEQHSVPVSFWNAGVLFAVIFAICTLLKHLKQLQVNYPTIRMMSSTIAIGVGIAIAAGTVGLIAEAVRTQTISSSLPWLVGGGVIFTIATLWYGARQNIEREVGVADNSQQLTQETANETIRTDQLSKLYESFQQATLLSRSVLLGSRDPQLNSCVNLVSTGQIQTAPPTNLGDYDGGPGTKLSVLMYFDRQQVNSASEDYQWFQTRLKTYLKNQIGTNDQAQVAVEHFEEFARHLAETFKQAEVWPDLIGEIQHAERSTWPDYCLTELSIAISAKNLEQARRWSGELATIAFSLTDLHRWLTFLNKNYLDALAFQAKCKDMFPLVDKLVSKYDIHSTPSSFPAGMLIQHNIENYRELERQAERMFTMPQDRLDTIAKNTDWDEFSLTVSPILRELYTKIRTVLSTNNRINLDLAAKSPFEHSYLNNMLYRVLQSGTTNELIEILKKFDAQYPFSSVFQLMGVFMYRGHSFAGLEWADRYHPQLIDAANAISNTAENSFVEACNWTNNFYRQHASYGLTFTLRASFEQKKIDCVRTTDMIGTLYRNAGHSGFGHVRWSTEDGGHSVAAQLIADKDKTKVCLLDGMNPSAQPEVWPNAYFQGHEWPAELRPKPQPYTAELFVRGLDNYIWAEGYILSGPNAGMLYKAKVPYLPNRDEALSTKVFDGPYPRSESAPTIDSPYVSQMVIA